MPQKPGGVGQLFCDGLLVEEVATSTCAHCANITDIPSRKKMMDHVDVCRNCMRLICLKCVGKPCTPFEKTIDRIEADYYRSVQLRKALGL